jgi:hypothetical protein
MTLTAGSELKVPATSSSVAGANLNHAIGLTDSLAIAFFVDDDGDAQVDLKAQLIDISALTATLDAGSKIAVRTNLITSSLLGYGCRLTDTSALYVYRYRLSGETDFTEVAQVFTISGSTITANAATTIRVVTSTSSDESWKLVALSSTKAMWCYWRYNVSDEWELFASVITISGTTPTINAAATVYTSVLAPTRDASTNRYDLVNASATTAVVQHTELDSGGSGWYEIFAYVLSAPSTTVTVGSAASMSSNDANNGSFETDQWLARLGDSTVASYTIDATSGDNAYQILALSGTTITPGTVSTETQSFEPNSPATGFESDLILAYDRGTTTANDEAVEFSSIGATIPAPSDTLAWTPTNRPDRQTPLTGAALPTVITSASSTSAPTGHLYVRLYRSSVTPTPPAPSPGTTGIYAISLSLDRENDGSKLFLTAFDANAGELILQRWDTATMTVDHEIPLGTSTLAEVQARTKIAYVFAASDDLVWIYGQMDSSGWAGPTGTFWLAESSTGGVSGSFSSFNLGWDANSTLAALNVSSDLSGTDSRLFTGIRCKTTTPPQLYQDLNALTLVSTTPLATGTFINHEAMDIGVNSGNVIVGGMVGAGSNRIVMSVPPYSTWLDMTDNHPSGTFQTVRFF